MRRSLLVLLLTAITIFTFVNGSQAQNNIINISNNAHNHYLYPKINDNGWVVWYGENHVWLFDGVSATQLGFGISPQINDDGDVVWEGYDGSDSEIFLYDGTLPPTQLTNNDYEDHNPRINNSGHVVWEGCVGGTELWCDTDWEILLYDGTLPPTQLTNNDYDDGVRMVLFLR